MAIIIIILGYGCTNELETRKAHWVEQLELFDPVGKENELLSWLNDQGIESHTDKPDLRAVLERVEGNGIVWSTWLTYILVSNN